MNTHKRIAVFFLFCVSLFVFTNVIIYKNNKNNKEIMENNTIYGVGFKESATSLNGYTYDRTMEFPYSGSVQNFIAANDGYYVLQVWGASGGGYGNNYGNAAGAAGRGGYSYGELTVTRGTKFFIYTGGTGLCAGPGLGKGGFNGGGSSMGSDSGEPGCGGGGASDIRLYTDSLYNRVIVAGGGGGGGEDNGDAVGAGGGTSGGSGGSSGGTQTSGGTGAVFGKGANTPNDGGAGGGGWYGGGTVNGSQTIPTVNSTNDSQGGGGGSGYVWTNANALNAPTNFALTKKDYLNNASTTAGTSSFTNTSGGTETGHMGNGYVRITCYSNCTGSTDLGGIYVNYGQENEQIILPEEGETVHDVYVPKDQNKAVFDVRPLESCASITSAILTDEPIQIASGITVYTAIVVGNDGETTVHTIKVHREVSNTVELDMIYIDGVKINGFDPSIHEYTLNFSYDRTTTDISVDKQNENQTVTNLGINEVDDNNEVINLNVTAENGYTKDRYTINIVREESAYLKTLTSKRMKFTSVLTPGKYNYKLLKNDYNSNDLLIIETADKDATYRIEGDLATDTTIKIIVSKTGFSDVTYTITQTENYDYSYTGAPEVFIAPYTAEYNLYVWGAEGGGRRTSGNSNHGLAGYGGFSTGTVYLEKGTKLYIYVGGQGSYSNGGLARGGYNGGGSSWASSTSEPAGGGGGATDIRLEKDNLYSRIIVAGGGGGGGEDPNDAYGHGGGTSGGSGGAAGGTQTSGGTGAVFGFGANTPNDGGAGGGGWYGGGTVNGSQTIPTGNSGSDAQGGGGGSGYVLTSTSSKPSGYTVDQKYYMTNAQTLIGSSSAIPTHDLKGTMTGNQGNGFALIKVARIMSDNNYLKSLSITIDGVDYPIAFDKDTNEYYVGVDSDHINAVINAEVEDDSADVFMNNDGKYLVPTGDSDYQLEVMAGNGDVRIYTIHFYRSSSDYKYLKDIKVNGSSISDFEPTKLNYIVRLPYYEVSNLLVEGEAARPEQRVIGNGVIEITEGSFSQLIQVYSEDGSKNTIYTITFIVDNSTKLKKLQIGEMTLSPKFFREKYYYEIQLTENPRDAYYDIVPYDPDATYTITGDLASGDNMLHIIVSEPHCEDTEYVLKSTGEYTFEPGQLTIWTAPVSGIYQLETWGAQGGYRSNSTMGGRGAYAKGTITVTQGQKLYVYVGTNGNNGGFNGGGAREGFPNNRGGGATDIRLSEDDLYSRIIVAAGGGSDGSTGRPGGYGGAAIGESRTQSYGSGGGGGTQTGGGAGGNNNSGTFGIGGTGLYRSNGYGGAGGGGWYGGGGTYPDGSADDDRGGGGGSSFALGDATNADLPSGYNVDEKYTLINTQLIAGNEVMPSYDHKSTMTGNGGDGYALITLLEAHSGDSTLSSLTTSKGVWDKEFNPKIKEYTILLDKEDYRVDIAATVNADTSIIRENDLGTKDIASPTDTKEILVTAEDGTTSLYILHFDRSGSSYKYLSDILIDGESIEGFQYDKFNYNINLKYDVENEVEVTGIYGRPSQVITGDGIIDVSSGKETIYIQVLSEDGSSVSTYTLTLNKSPSTKLKSITTGQYGEFSLNPEFSPDETKYTLEVLPSTLSLPITTVAYDSSAKVTIKGNGYISKSETNVTITVTKDGIEPTIYEINVIKPKEFENPVFDFDYTGDVQEFTATLPGNYQIEVWGAEGMGRRLSGNSSSGLGGLGGYSIGTLAMKPGETIYIYVGGTGTPSTGGIGRGGYNGGGSSFATSSGEPSNGGGGATDVRATVGDLYSRFIVAGGGGGGGEDAGDTRGAGGGTSGGSGGAAGGTQTSGGTGAVFGFGASTPNDGGGGGGGWYGGGAKNGSQNIPTKNSTADGQGGGGGSGYVFTASTIQYYPSGRTIDEKYLLSDAKTISGTSSMPNVNGGYTTGRQGNGYARITYLTPPSSNNFLESLDINRGDIDSGFDKENPDITEYVVEVDSKTTEVEIKAAVADSTATLVGNGVYDIPAGETSIELTVTAEDGSVRIYTITFKREASSDDFVSNIAISGFIPSLCSLSEEYCNYTFDPSTTTYKIVLPRRIKQLQFTAVKGHKYQVVTYEQKGDEDYYETDGIASLTNEINDFKVIITSEDGSNSIEYNYEIKRDMTGNNDLLSLKMETENITTGDNGEVSVITDLLESEFNMDVTEYYVTLPRDFNEVKLTAIADDPSSTIEVYNITKDEILDLDSNGSNNLIFNEDDFGKMIDIRVTVTASNGEEKIYYIYLWLALDDNVFLENIEVYDYSADIISTYYELSPVFNKMVTNYTINVPNEVSRVKIIPTKASSHATTNESEYYSLNTGVNKIELTVTSEDKAEMVYKITINRAKNSNTDLSLLRVLNPDDGTEYNLEEIFDKDTLIYHTTVPPSVYSLTIDAIAAVPATSTVTVSGNTSIKSGSNTIKIRVTAEDRSYKEYYIYVDRTLSDENSLDSLILSNNGEELSYTPEFSGDINTYNLNVPNTVKYIDVKATAVDSRSKITGNGRTSLVVGDNRVEVTVISESGISNTYIINVNRKQSSNAYLTSITNNQNATLSPNFDKETESYTIVVPKETTSITLTGTPEEITSTVIGNEEINLNVGNNYHTITVTAEDGTIKNYSINIIRDLSTINTLDSLLVEEGIISPSFNKDTLLYTVTVPNDITDVTIRATTTSSDATINIIKPDSLVVGENIVQVEVIPEKGVDYKKIYNITVTREPERNTYLSYLGVSIGVLSPEFDKTTVYYDVDVPSDTDSVEIFATAESSIGTVNGTGVKSIAYGDNKFYVTVSTFDGTTRTYTLNIHRPKPKTASLLTLTTDKGDILPAFVSSNYKYQIYIDDDVESINIDATTTSDNTISGIGEVLTPNYEIKHNVVVINEDGDTAIYEIDIIKASKDSVYIKELNINNGVLIPEFNKVNENYEITIPKDIDSLDISVVLESLNATYVVNGNDKLQEGDNTITIVVSNNALSKTYQIIVHKQGDPVDTTYLSSLSVENYDITPIFDEEISYYELVVPNSIDEVNIMATAKDPSSTISGTGLTTLSLGDNNKYITVTDPISGNSRTYTIKITRNVYDCVLTSITSDVGEIIPSFASSRNDYILIVPIETTDYEISATAPNGISIIGAKTYTLVEGQLINIIAVSPTGETNIYKLMVTSDETIAHSVLAKNVVVKEGELNPEFDMNKDEYLLKIPYEIENPTYEVTPLSPNATYEIIGGTNLQVGPNPVIIRIHNGDDYKDYNLNIIRQAPATKSNYLTSITTNRGTLSPTFDKTRLYYTLTVDNEITTIKIEATKEDEDATLTGTGIYPLTVGENIIPIKVTSSDGVERTYQVLITRRYSANSKLARLVIDGEILNPSFDKDITNYNIETSKSKLVFSEIVPEDPSATYEIINNKLVVGNNTITIRVTAQDKTSTTDYILNVIKNPSNNNNLKELSIEDVEFTEEFNKGNTLYYATVPSSMNNINIIATPEDENAIVTGVGIVELEPGENIIEVNVTSESGTLKVYTIVITKELDTNNYLSDLSIEETPLNEVFEREEINYSATVPYDVETININAIAESESATITGSGERSLEVGINTINVEVIAESGNIRTYIITITRERCISPYIKSINTGHYNLDPNFDKLLFEYILTVDYEVSDLVLDETTITLEDDQATITSVTGNTGLSVGLNTVVINTLSSNGIDTATYTITVNRLPYANNFLAYIGLSSGTLSPEFNKTTYDYSVIVPNNNDTITITTEPDVSSSKVTINSITTNSYPLVVPIKLNEGINNIPIEVKSSSGLSRIYNIKVTRELSSNNKLKDLVVKKGTTVLPFVNSTFDPDTNTYYLDNLPVGTESLNIIATKQDETATISGDKEVNLVGGENRLEVVVTAANGDINTYTIIVNRIEDDNNFLTDLVPSVGQLEPDFDYYGTEYTLRLSANASLLSFEATRESPYSTVTGTEQQPVLNGTNDRLIYVTAENGDVKTITIHVIKAREDEARLQELRVGSYTLDPIFDKDTYSYNITVPYEYKILLPSDITAIPIDPGARVTKPSALTLNTGVTNVYNIKVTALDGFTEQTYTLNITRERGSDATLSSLSIKNYNITPELSNDNFNYTVYVPRGTTEISESDVIAIPSDSAAKVNKLNYISVTGEEDNIYTIEVISDDGNHSNIYNIRIDFAPNSDARLATLEPSVGTLSPEFNSDTYSYTLSLNSIQDSVTFAATTVSEYAEIVSGLETVNVNTLTMKHVISIVAEDGTIKNYEITINRSSGTDANLKLLEFSENTKLTPVFDPYTYEYNLAVPKGTTVIENSTVHAIPNDPYANVTIPETFNINDTNRTYTITVTSANNEVTQDYVIHVDFIYSNEARLQSLTSDVGTLSPEFNSDTYSYTLAVRDTQNSINIDAIPIDENAIIISGTGTINLPDKETAHEIIVQAENGSTKVYRLNIEKSITTERYLENIELTGYESENCNTLINWCVLSSEFSPTTTEYSLIVPPDVEVLGMIVNKRSEYQTITYTKLDGTPFNPDGFGLEYGRNTFDVTVTNGLGQSTVYRYTIERKASENANLTDIVLSNPTPNQSIDFDPNLVEYSVTIDNEYTSIDVTATTEDADASYRVIGNTQLWEGNNDVIIEVTAKSGNIKQYIIHVYRNPSHNNLLSSLTVSTGNIVALNPTFTPTTKVYTARVPSTASSALISAVPQVYSTIVEGAGEFALDYGLNSFDIVATPEQGDPTTYTINIIREEINNVNLANLVVRNGTLTPAFDQALSSYKVYVDSTINSLNMSVTLDDPNATYTIGGNKNFVTGNNTVSIKVTSANKRRVKTYLLDVIKDGSHNTNLSMIKVDNENLEGFNVNTKEYDIVVPENKDSINIIGILEDIKSSITGNGSYSLSHGSNVITLIVTSESGDISTYRINVFREYNTYLESLTIDESNLEPTFIKTTQEYTVHVGKDVEGITVLGRKEDPNATVTGNGYYTLEKGENSITISVTNGEATPRDYIINVIRAYDDINTLDNLVASEGEFTYPFTSETLQYYLSVPYETTSLNLLVQPTSEYATYKVEGNENFTLCTEEDFYCNTVTITVLSEENRNNNSEGRQYILHVNRSEDESVSSKLESLTISEGTLTPAFDRDTFAYMVDVDSTVTSIAIDAIPEESDSTITGTGIFRLAYGNNSFSIVVTNRLGNKHTYTVTINRHLSDEARIESLGFLEGSLNENFDPDVYNYTMNISNNISNLTEQITMMDSLGKYHIIGNKALAGGINTITIKTDSPSRTEHKTYTITVNKSLSLENYLLTLTSNIGTFDKVFDKDINNYTLTVPYGTNSIILSGTASDKATVNGLGLKNLTSDREIVNINVASEEGTVNIYTIVIEREKNPDNYLKFLSVREGDLSPEFDKDTLRYSLNIESDITEVNITAIASSEDATIDVEIPSFISYGTTSIPITVRAANGTTRTYTIDVIKQRVASAKIANLKIFNGEINPEFISTTNNYLVTVPGDVNELNMEIELEDDRATYVVTGNLDFRTGMNVVTITVTNEDLEEVYTLKVDKQILSNNYLNNLYTDRGDLSPEFSPSTLNYSMTVDSTVERIGIFAEPNDSLATVTGTGMQTLLSGENIFKVVVTSRTGVSRTYTITINREASTENKLLSLSSDKGNFNPLFDPDINTYTLTVPAETESVELSGEISQRAQVVGLGSISLTPGTTAHTIVVTSEAGTANVYTINIVRPLSTNALVTSIVPSVGVLTPEFDNNTKVYNIELFDNSISNISFDVTTASPFATVTGNEETSLNFGNNVITITATAEDGVTTNTFTINVRKVKIIEDIIVPESITISPYGETDIVVNYEPADTEQTGVTFQVVGRPLVEVDENGHIISNGTIGVTNILVTSKYNPTITKTIQINIEVSEITSSVYEIRRDVIMSDFVEHPVDSTIDYVRGIQPGETTINDFLNNFDNDRGMLHVYYSDGTEVTDNNELVATNMVLKLESGDIVYDELKITVFGDGNGDGYCDALDYTTVNRYLLFLLDINDASIFALDVNDDGYVDALDYTTMNRYLLYLLDRF